MVGIGLPAVALIVAVTVAALGVGHALGGPDPDNRTTLAVACATRFPALALLIASLNFPNAKPLPIVVSYLLISALTVIPVPCAGGKANGGREPSQETSMGSILPFPTGAFGERGRTRRLQDSSIIAASRKPPAQGRAQYPDHPAGRRGIWAARHLWRPGSYADAVALANEGISYNTFHTTSICSPTRAALLTGRNHQRVGSGTIAERAVDWDGYTGVIPRTSATLAKVLGDYGYKTAAFGKWHNTPADPDHGDGAVHALADRRGHRLRLFLWLSGGRDVAMGAAALSRISIRSSRRTTRNII